jgi:hypothetical protein
MYVPPPLLLSAPQIPEEGGAASTGSSLAQVLGTPTNILVAGMVHISGDGMSPG